MRSMKNTGHLYMGINISTSKNILKIKTVSCQCVPQSTALAQGIEDCNIRCCIRMFKLIYK